MSVQAPEATRLAAWTAHALALLDTLGVGPVDIIGNSMDGVIALSVARARPQAVRRIVLISPAGPGSGGLSSGAL